MKRYLLPITFLVCLIAPTFAHADYVYEFHTNLGITLSFDTASLLTTTQSFSIVPITVGNTTFDKFSVTVSGSDECFFFGAGYTGDCSSQTLTVAPTDPAQFTYTTFTNATSVGSYTWTGGANLAHAQNFTVFAGNLMSLTISETPAVPEPSSLMLLGSGLAGFAGVIRRKLNR